MNIIVHTLDEVNRGLRHGEYFWVDIARDGVVLYNLPGSELATPMPMNWPASTLRSSFRQLTGG